MRKSERGQKPCPFFLFVCFFKSARAMTQCISRSSRGNMCPEWRVHIETENANHIWFLISECNTTFPTPMKKRFLYNKNDPKLHTCTISKVSWSLKGSQGKNRGVSRNLCYVIMATTLPQNISSLLEAKVSRRGGMQGECKEQGHL